MVAQVAGAIKRLRRPQANTPAAIRVSPGLLVRDQMRKMSSTIMARIVTTAISGLKILDQPGKAEQNVRSALQQSAPVLPGATSQPVSPPEILPHDDQTDTHHST